MKPQCVTILMKAIEQYFHVVLVFLFCFFFLLLITRYKVALTFKFVDETLVYDHSDESYQAVLSCGTV